MQGVNNMSPNLNFLDADKDGRLPPAIVNILFLFFLIVGLIGGWFAHMNYALRGEASQIVEDMEVGEKNKKRLQENLDALYDNIEETNNDKRFKNEDCLNYSNSEFAHSLRNNSRDEGE